MHFTVEHAGRWPLTVSATGRALLASYTSHFPLAPPPEGSLLKWGPSSHGIGQPACRGAPVPFPGCSTHSSLPWAQPSRPPLAPVKGHFRGHPRQLAQPRRVEGCRQTEAEAGRRTQPKGGRRSSPDSEAHSPAPAFRTSTVWKRFPDRRGLPTSPANQQASKSHPSAWSGFSAVIRGEVLLPNPPRAPRPSLCWGSVAVSRPSTPCP